MKLPPHTDATRKTLSAEPLNANTSNRGAPPPQGAWNAQLPTADEADGNDSGNANANDNGVRTVLPGIPPTVRQEPSARSRAMQRALDLSAGHAAVPARHLVDMGVRVATAGAATNMAALLTGPYARHPGAALVTLVIGNAVSTEDGPGGQDPG